MARSRGSKRTTTPAAEAQPAVVVVTPDREWIRFRRAHMHDRVQRVTGERLQVSAAMAVVLVERLAVAERVD